MHPCKSTTKSGRPCRAPAGPGGLCFFHANPDKTRVLGQVGGRKNRSKLPEPPAVGSLSAADLREILAGAIRDVQSKKITPRTAGALAQLCNSLYRVLQTADLESRLARIEQQLAEQECRDMVDSDPLSSLKPNETAEMDSTSGEEGRVCTEGRAEGEDDDSTEGESS